MNAIFGMKDEEMGPGRYGPFLFVTHVCALVAPIARNRINLKGGVGFAFL